MAALKTHKVVAAPPGTPEANSIYFVKNGAGVDIYVTNSTGTIVSYPLNRPIALSAFVGGKPTASETVTLIAVPVACTLPAGLTGSIVKAGVAATASAALSLRKNGVQFGTATFAAGGTTATLAAATATTFAVGDLLAIVAPASADATLADIASTLIGA